MNGDDGPERPNPRLPLILRLPRGLREEPAWVFIGLLVGLVGASYLIGFSESSISVAVGPSGLQLWGGALAFSGFAVVYATIRARPALEKLALRLLSVCMFLYGGWLPLVIGPRRAAMSIALTLILIALAEIRVAVLKLLLRDPGERP